MATPNLLDRLRALLREGVLRRDSLEDETRRRLVAVVLSVVVAFVLWFTFSMRESYSLVVDVPIVIQSLPEGRALARRPPEQARVTVQGEGWELLKLRRRPPTLDIRTADEEVNVFAAASESNRFPPGVSVQNVLPAAITLDLEPRITRALPVRIEADLDAAPLYDFLSAPAVEPETVLVSGARSIVNAMRDWPTVRLERDEVSGSFTAEVPLSDTLRGLVAKETDRVRVTVSAGLFTEAVRELEVRTEGAPPGSDPIRFIPSRVTVTYRVPVEQYERSRETSGFYAFVPYAVAINDTTGSVQPVLHFPEELFIRDARLEPRRLQYRVRVE